MRPLSPVLASLASVFRIQVLSHSALARPVANRTYREISMSTPTTSTTTANNLPTGGSFASTARTFSSTSFLAKRKGSGPRGDRRITLIRYFLHHPLTPRPLRFSRTRFLRHWTIHRAWQLHQTQQRRARELELQRQWQAMQAACEELRTGAGDGGKLFRISMNKKGVFRDLFPIEYGRLQTESPSKEGWNHEWKRMERK